MLTVYAPPPETAYLTSTPFYMPTDGGDVWAIAFTTTTSQFLNAALSVIFTLIFPCPYLISAVVPPPCRD